MSFVPSIAPATKPLDHILAALTTDSTDPKALSQADLEIYRLQLAAVKKLIGTKMAETSTKEHNYDDDAIVAYIDDVLEDGYNLNETELSDYPEFIDAQRLKRWSTVIAERVEASRFGSQKFKIHSLRLLRSNIASAKTLHDLRKAVTMMISPLELWREHLKLVDLNRKSVKKVTTEFESQLTTILLENEALVKVAAERKRVIDSLLSCYNEVDTNIALLQKCDSAKKEHNLSDAQVCDMFGLSRNKLNTLRKDIDLNASPTILEDAAEPKAPVDCSATEYLHWEHLRLDYINQVISNIAKEQSDEAYSY